VGWAVAYIILGIMIGVSMKMTALNNSNEAQCNAFILTNYPELAQTMDFKQVDHQALVKCYNKIRDEEYP